MKKSLILLLAGIFALSSTLLCGCSNETESSESSENPSSGSSSSSTSSSSSESSAESSASTESKPFELSVKTPTGELIRLEDIFDVEKYNAEIDLSKVTDISELADSTVYTDIAYYAPPTGVFKNTIDDPGSYDPEQGFFEGVPFEKYRDILSAKEGDVIGDFTVKSAKSTYLLYEGGGGYFASTEMELDGKAELTGYIAVVSGDVYTFSDGDIRFVPASCNNGIPVVRIDLDDDGTYYTPRGSVFYFGDDEYFTGDYPEMRLGNVADCPADLTGVPRDNSYIKVKITAENLRLETTPEWFTNVYGTITDITIL